MGGAERRDCSEPRMIRNALSVGKLHHIPIGVPEA